MAESMRFPPAFRWGVATASFQNEGGNQNNWSRWEQTHATASGEPIGKACDWWAHAEDDFDRAQALGLNALRLSLEWSRIEPRADVWDRAAIVRYRAMLRALRERGLEPMVTLHHFTHPLWFEDRGGFLAADAAERFARYASYVVDELGDLCDLWVTINEPNVYATFGYLAGIFPPGRQGDALAMMRVQAAMARAHAAAYQAIHAAQPAARVGWAQHYNLFDPAHEGSPTEGLVTSLQDAAFNDFFPRAVRSGQALFPFSLLAGDLSAVRDTCDFVGINVYYRDRMVFDISQPSMLFGRRVESRTGPHGDVGGIFPVGEVYPQGIARAARRAAELDKPVYVTENGVADHDDRLRPWALVHAVCAMREALDRGVDLRGYYHWTLVDNYEWADGWSLRFGLIALDPKTQRRTPRPSAELYSTIARANALSDELVTRYSAGALAEIFPLRADDHPPGLSSTWRAVTHGNRSK